MLKNKIILCISRCFQSYWFDLSTSLKNFATVLLTLAHFATPMRCHKTDSEQFFASRLFQELGELDALFASSTRLQRGQWSFNNYVDTILPPPLCVDSFCTLSVDKNRHFLTPSPPHLVHVVIEWPQRESIAQKVRKK